MSDKETINVYDARAKEYARSFEPKSSADPALAAFLQALLPKGRILDLGCGPGTWSALMLEQGFDVDAVDASASMIEAAAQIPGLNAWQARFDEIDAENIYDGIWANFSLLHAPRSEMPQHLSMIRRALRPDGVVHIGLKEGTGEQRDALGRFYTYYTIEELSDLLRAQGLTPGTPLTGASKGLDGTVAAWFTMVAHG